MLGIKELCPAQPRHASKTREELPYSGSLNRPLSPWQAGQRLPFMPESSGTEAQFRAAALPEHGAPPPSLLLLLIALGFLPLVSKQKARTCFFEAAPAQRSFLPGCLLRSSASPALVPRSLALRERKRVKEGEKREQAGKGGGWGCGGKEAEPG